jgi:hypothetical protein
VPLAELANEQGFTGVVNACASLNCEILRALLRERRPEGRLIGASSHCRSMSTFITSVTFEGARSPLKRDFSRFREHSSILEASSRGSPFQVDL